jgi:hypothetical protein
VTEDNNVISMQDYKEKKFRKGFKRATNVEIALQILEKIKEETNGKKQS